MIHNVNDQEAGVIWVITHRSKPRNEDCGFTRSLDRPCTSVAIKCFDLLRSPSLWEIPTWRSLKFLFELRIPRMSRINTSKALWWNWFHLSRSNGLWSLFHNGSLSLSLSGTLTSLCSFSSGGFYSLDSTRRFTRRRLLVEASSNSPGNSPRQTSRVLGKRSIIRGPESESSLEVARRR